MAVQYAFGKIVTQGLDLNVDAADPTSYPGTGTTWTSVVNRSITGSLVSCSFSSDFKGGIVFNNPSASVEFPGTVANYGTGSFTIEMAFRPSSINGIHYLVSKNSGSFPNWGVYLSGSGGQGKLVSEFRVSTNLSSSTVSNTVLTTQSRYDATIIFNPSQGVSFIYLNGTNDILSIQTTGSGTLTSTGSLLVGNTAPSSSQAFSGSIFNTRFYRSTLTNPNIITNFKALSARLGLSPGVVSSYILDNINSTAAYSVTRRLKNSYTGPAFTVRRSSDNQTLDIGFNTNGDVDINTALSFVGSSNGTVISLYDQTGNGNTLTGGMTLISAGSLVTATNGKAAITVGGLSKASAIGALTEVSLYYVFNPTNGASSVLLPVHTHTGGAGTAGYWKDQGGAIKPGYEWKLFNTTSRTYGYPADMPGTGTYLWSSFHTGVGTTMTGYLNSISKGTNTAGGSYTSGSTFSIDGSTNNKIQEVIVIPDGTQNLRPFIESNINNYYTIF